MRKTFVIRRRGGVYVLPLDSVIYMENRGRKVIVHTREGTIEFNGRLSDVVNSLDGRFMMCHRSYAINMDNIAAMRDGSVIFSDRSRVFLGRDTFRKARKHVDVYMGEGRKISGEK